MRFQAFASIMLASYHVANQAQAIPLINKGPIGDRQISQMPQVDYSCCEQARDTLEAIRTSYDQARKLLDQIMVPHEPLPDIGCCPKYNHPARSCCLKPDPPKIDCCPKPDPPKPTCCPKPDPPTPSCCPKPDPCKSPCDECSKPTLPKDHCCGQLDNKEHDAL